MNWNGKERRRFPRGDVYCKVFVYPTQAHIISAYTENISDAGLRAIFPEELKVSSLVHIELFLQPEEPTICKGKVIWVSKIEGDSAANPTFYDTGIEFLEEIHLPAHR